MALEKSQESIMILLKIFSLIAMFIIFMVIMFFVTAIGSIRSMMRNFRNPTGNTSNGNGQTYRNGRAKGDETVYNSTSPRKEKIIPRDEGEYVDYEELK